MITFIKALIGTIIIVPLIYASVLIPTNKIKPKIKCSGYTVLIKDTIITCYGDTLHYKTKRYGINN